MVHHGVEVAGGHQKRKTGFAKSRKGFRAVPVRLDDQRHAVALAFEQARNDGCAEAGMVDIRIPGDKHKIGLPDISRVEFRAGDGREMLFLFGHSISFAFAGRLFRFW